MQTEPKSIVLVVVTAIAASIALEADSPRFSVLVGRNTLPPGQVLSVVVDADTGAVDSATVSVMKGTFDASIGDDVRIDAPGGGVGGIFTGEVVSIEPVFDPDGSAHVRLRAFNRLHRLTRERTTRTFENVSDADIIAQLAQAAGLSAESSGPEVTTKYDHVFQHNQTDLEFLLVRAARIGYEVFVDDKTLNFRRRLDPPVVVLACAPTRDPSSVQLELFHARLASANQVSKVTVRGWDPQRQEEITAVATRRMIPLSDAGARLINPPGTLLDLGFVQPLATADTSYGAAVGTLAAATALDVSGEAASDGSPTLRVGALVSIDGVGTAFNGKYFVSKVSHVLGGESREAWHTLMRVTRSDRAIYVLPEIGDDVLVRFEHGDIGQPVIVGSLWDRERPPSSEEKPCRSN